MELRARGLVPNSYSLVSWEYKNRLHIHECGIWETGHYNYVLEIMRLRSLMGIHKSEPDIYIGFSSALHLQ
jgi:hypothetical protein